MKILITNTNFETRGGAQGFVRGLTGALQSLGHSALVYTNDPGQSERLLENDSLPLATDIENLPFSPDVIHAQHHLDAMPALAALPGVPAVYHSHGAIWKDCVVKHPRIYRYLVMSRTSAHRISVESNISPDNIEVFPNAVDLNRFTKVRTLPKQPRRALFFNRHHAADSPTVSAIRVATSKRGLELDCVGYYFGRSTEEPENVLPSYDIVFASGLSAIEALASGCAVVVLGRTSCGDMVQPENFDSFRDTNFSIATNSPPPSIERIETQLRHYSPKNCAVVTERIRREAGFGKSVTRLLEIYQGVIEEHLTRSPNPRAESFAMSKYLRRIVPVVRITDQMLARN
jgi:glycosyltransferase involved in cell wall biosynthesis